MHFVRTLAASAKLAGIALALAAVSQHAAAQGKGLDEPFRDGYKKALAGKTVGYIPVAMGFDLVDVVWCQDEPQNQGAWFFVQHYIHENMQEGQKLGYAGRAASASPAVGYSHLHQEQQKALVDAAFAKLKGFVLTK